MAPAYTTSDRGACHRRTRPIEHEVLDGDWGADRTAAKVIREQDRRSTFWSLIADDFFGDTLDDLGRKWFESVGLDPAGGLATVGERAWNMTRLFSVRGSIPRKDDSLLAALQEPLESGPRAGATVDRDDFDSMLDAYCRCRGWTVDGVPTTQTIDRLGLAALTDDFDTLDDWTPHERLNDEPCATQRTDVTLADALCARRGVIYIAGAGGRSPRCTRWRVGSAAPS